MAYVVIILCKIVSYITGIFGGGTSLPGKLALKMRPKLLKTLLKNMNIVLVTGTNGKTTTCAELVSILKETGSCVINNTSGANMKDGITSCLIRQMSLIPSKKKTFAVLEADEAYLRFITEDITPDVIAVTNIFRDQLDRYGEVDTTLKLITEGCKNAPDATLVLNGDEPLLCDFMPDSKKYYFGFRVNPNLVLEEEINAEGRFCKDCKNPLQYRFTTFNHLGHYACPSCGKQRPQLSLGVNKVPVFTADGSEVSFDDLEIKIPLPGAYNVYNALCAATVAGALGVCPEDIKNGIENQGSRFGRQETIMIDGREVRLILVKNPAGFNEAINSVLPDDGKVNLGFLLNDRYADGTDVSWIYDVHFENLIKMQYEKILVGGIRQYDMAIRLKYAGFDTGRFHVCDDFDGLLYTVRTNITGRLYLFATYTAMTSFRRFLHKKKYIKNVWK